MDIRIPPLQALRAFEAIALHEDDRQNAMFAEILAIPGIEEKWDGEEVESIFARWQKQAGQGA